MMGSINDLISTVENKTRYTIALETICFDATLPDGTTLSDKINECNKIIEQIKFDLLLSNTPNPDCEYCLGEGEFYWHSSDCKNDDCRLAGGYGDCAGEMSQCGCSISDRLEDAQIGRKDK